MLIDDRIDRIVLLGDSKSQGDGRISYKIKIEWRVKG